MTPNPYVKQYLMTAGPTPVPPAVSQAMAAPMLYHRAPAFVEVYERVLGKLPHVFQTSNDVLTFSASGSGAMDSAAANLVRPGKPVLACAAGKFGERWIELCEAYGGETVRYEPGWGERLDPAEIDRLLGENDGIEVVLATLSETSTGIVHDVQAIAEVVRRHGALLARATRAGVAALGLELFGDPDERANVVTAIELPADVDGAKVPGALRRLGITANGGQDALKGRILRIAHCGYFGAFDIVTSLSGLEMVLAQLGHEVDHGAGVGSAQRVFMEAGVPAAA